MEKKSRTPRGIPVLAAIQKAAFVLSALAVQKPDFQFACTQFHQSAVVEQVVKGIQHEFLVAVLRTGELIESKGQGNAFGDLWIHQIQLILGNVSVGDYQRIWVGKLLSCIGNCRPVWPWVERG